MINTTPEAVGLSSSRLERVTSWLNEQITSERLAGASVLVSRHGKIAYFESCGQSEIETARPFNQDTVLRVYSMSKPITTVAAMMCYEQGCFQFDEPVSLYIPEFAATPVWAGGDAGIEQTNPATNAMTIHHLMTHTSGLTYGFMHSNVVDQTYRDQKLDIPSKDMTTLEQWTARLAKIPLMCEPGGQWNYSVSTDVLGRLVEIWSGQSLADYLEQHIFTPLNMCDTGFHVRAENHDRFAALYAPLSGGDLSNVSNASASHEKREGGLLLQEAVAGSSYLQPTTLYSGGGGLASTMHDYTRLCLMLRNGGELDGARLLSRKTVEYMRQNHLPDNRDMAAMGQPVWSETNYDGIGFGLGFAVVIDPIKAQIITSPGEHHWGGAASTFFWLDPVEDLFVIFLTQLFPSSTYPIRRELRTRIYQTLID